MKIESNEIATNKKSAAKFRACDIIYFITALIMPNIFLFHLYNQNHVESHLVFSHIIILSGILAVMGLLLFVALKFIIKLDEGALLIAILFWVLFWLFESMLRVIGRNFEFMTSTIFLVLLILLLISITVAFRLYKPPFSKVRPVFFALAVGLIAIFTLNLIPAFSHRALVIQARDGLVTIDGENAGEVHSPQRNFVVDFSLSQPDIHWFHLDAMMSLNSIESFIGENQDLLRDELAKRGFIINEDATLSAGATAASVTALLSPTFYDNFFSYILTEAEDFLTSEHHRHVVQRLAENGLVFEENIFPYHELLSALSQAGYNLAGDSPHWLMLENHNDFSLLGDLPELLIMTTPLTRIPFITDRSISTEAAQPTPNLDIAPAVFTFHYYNYMHPMMWWIWDSETFTEDTNESQTRFDLMPLAHHHQTQVLLDEIDAILEQNPDAVIVLQADHGPHTYFFQNILLLHGYTMEFVLELFHSVFSAVRISEKYGGLDEPIAPLNISRELVNRFVGQNYDLLP